MLNRRNFIISILGATSFLQNSEFRSNLLNNKVNDISVFLKKEFIKIDIPIIGVHGLLTDPPFGSMLVLNNAIKDTPKGSTNLFLNFIKEIKLNAFRFYDGYWWSPNGSEKTAYTLKKMGQMGENELNSFIKNNVYIDGFELIDFFGVNNLTLVLHVDSIFFDKITKEVYLTKEVANNPEILKKAVFENVVKFIEYYKNKKYKNKFIIEIGNEGMGYGKDLMPSIEERTKIIKAYSKGAKESSLDVGVAFTAEEYLGFFDSKESLDLLDGYQNYLDYFVFHPYEISLRMDKELTRYPLKDYLDKFSKRLDKKGFTKSKFLLTEYNFFTYEPSYKKVSYEYGIKNFDIILPAIFHERVAGVFIHAFPNYEYGNYSDGINWSLVDISTNNPNHIKDNSGLEPRWRKMSSGVIHQIFLGFLEDIKYLKDISIQKEVITILAETNNELKILVINLNKFFEKLVINNISIKQNKILGEYLKDKNDSKPKDLEQSWIIKKIYGKIDHKNEILFSFEPNSITVFSIPIKEITYF